MKNIKKWMSCLLVSTMVLTLFAGCGSSSDSGDTSDESEGGPVEITFWHSMGNRNGEALENIVQSFNDSQEDIHVNIEYQGSYDDAFAKLKTTPEGQRPDVMQIYEQGCYQMINSDYFLSVQDYIDEENYDLSDFHDMILGWYTVDDTLYGMPFNVSIPAITYNIEALEAAGVNPETDLQTFDDVLAAAQKVADAGVCQYGVCLDNDAWLFEEFVSMLGGYLTDNENGRAGAATKLIIDENGLGEEILSFWRDFSSNSFAVTYGGGLSGTAEAKKEFGAGNVAMLISTCGIFRDVQDGADGTFTVGQRCVPKFHEGDTFKGSVGGGALWIINNGNGNDEKADAAWEFIKYCTDPEIQAEWVNTTGYLPLRKSAEETEIYQQYLEENPRFTSVVAQMDETSSAGLLALMGCTNEMRSIIPAEIQKLLDDESYTVEEALDTIVNDTNEAITRFNESNGIE